MKEYLNYIVEKVRKVYPEYNINYNSSNWIYIETREKLLLKQIKEIENFLGNNWVSLNGGSGTFNYFLYFTNKKLKTDARTYYLNLLLETDK